MEKTRKLALIVLDGWGIGGKDPKINAIAAANTPFMDSLFKKYPHTQLSASGEDVGLPDGQMGNSEVGHMNIGAGRVVYQQLVLINRAFKNHEVNNNPVLLDAFAYAKTNNKKIHLLGLVSDGGIHSSIGHLEGLCEIAAKNGCKDVFIHAFTDGRDADPHSGKGFLQDLQNHLDKTTGKIASVTGRYYAMDRDKRWERVKMAYDAVVKGVGQHTTNAIEAIEQSYKEGVTDEFIKPIIVTDSADKPLATIGEGDVVIFFNFRTDRGRELTLALSQQAYPDFDMKPLSLHYITMTMYDHTFKNVQTVFPEQDLQMTLGEVIEKAGLTQLRAAETEKYPHVTFFFSGGRELPFEGEKRIMQPSPKVATYDLQPAMSAPELADAVDNEINTAGEDLIVLNFANPDMVGHSGVFSGIVEAVETVDKCAEKVVTTCLKNDYIVIIIADHGNAEYKVNANGTPNTAHTTNPVPFLLLDDQHIDWKLKPGRLADIAPTILKLMHLPIPEQMTGEVLAS